MSLKHALLGFLNYGPMTGYELKKFFDTSVAHFWNAELSQIYPTLKAMDSEGLVEMEVDVQADRPNRKVYTITDDGRRNLLEWLAKPAEPEQVREPILIKVFFGANVSREELIRVLQQQVKDLKGYGAYLQQCEFMIARFAEGIGMAQEAPFWALTPKLGMKHCQAEAEWAEGAIQTVEQMPDSAFAHCHEVGHMEVRTAMEILEKAKAIMPQAHVGARPAASSGGEEAETA